MKKLTDQLKSVAKSLSSLSMQVEKVLKEVDKLSPPKKSTTRKAVAKKATTKKKTGRKVAVKRTVAKKKSVRKVAAKKVPAKKKPALKTATQPTVLDKVLNVVKRSKKGATINVLKEKTGLNPKQLSNSLYKLSKRGLIVAKSRGLYVKK